MKGWLVALPNEHGFWVTRFESHPGGPDDYLCGFCDGQLNEPVVAFFASSKGNPGVVACSICGRCDWFIGDHELPAGELATCVERLLASEPAPTPALAHGFGHPKSLQETMSQQPVGTKVYLLNPDGGRQFVGLKRK